MFGLPIGLDVPVRGVILACVGLAWVIVLTRVIGLRSFSKMTAFDFVVTLAVASLLASAAAATNWPQLFQSLFALSALLVVQFGLAKARRSSSRFRETIENTPLMLMRDGEFIDRSLTESRVSRQDILAKIRQANVNSISEVKAVVLETTGDISVLSGDTLDHALIAGVRSL